MTTIPNPYKCPPKLWAKLSDANKKAYTTMMRRSIDCSTFAPWAMHIPERKHWNVLRHNVIVMTLLTSQEKQESESCTPKQDGSPTSRTQP